jgi:hypothetical protein
MEVLETLQENLSLLIKLPLRKHTAVDKTEDEGGFITKNQSRDGAEKILQIMPKI